MKRLLIITSIIFALCGCSKESKVEPLTVSPTALTLHYNETGQINTNATSPKFTSSDTYYATVDETGLVKAGKVGDTKIIVNGENGTASVSVSVKPVYTLYPNVDELIDATKSSIISAMGNDYTENVDKNGEAVLMYTKYNNYSGLAFTFKGDKVDAIIAMVPTLYTKQLTDYLIERYTIAGTQDGYYFFYNHDKKVVIALTVYSANVLAVTYIKSVNAKSSYDLAIPDGMESLL